MDSADHARSESVTAGTGKQRGSLSSFGLLAASALLLVSVLVGCPGREVLAQLARLPLDRELSHLLEHVRKCAPCFDELKQLRKGRIEAL